MERPKGLSVCGDGFESFSLAGVPADQRDALWEAVMARTQLPMSVRIGPQPRGECFKGALRRWSVEDLVIVDFECGPVTAARTRSHVAASAAEFTMILVGREGSERLQFGDTSLELRPRDVAVFDSTLPGCCFTDQRIAKSHLLIPTATFSEAIRRPRAMPPMVLDGAEPAVDLFVNFLHALRERHRALPRVAANGAAIALLALLGAAVRKRHGLDQADLRPALRIQIERWIDRQLAVGPVTPCTAAAAHGVSVRTVHRLFHEAGTTLGAYVRERRLTHAKTDLSGADVLLSTIARHWGFADASHLSRTFKARYGVAPSDYRTAIREAHSLEIDDG
jgi:AraC-like DNA-binding protein